MKFQNVQVGDDVFVSLGMGFGADSVKPAKVTKVTDKFFDVTRGKSTKRFNRKSGLMVGSSSNPKKRFYQTAVMGKKEGLKLIDWHNRWAASQKVSKRFDNLPLRKYSLGTIQQVAAKVAEIEAILAGVQKVED